VHGAIVKDHPEAYPVKADFRIDAVRLRDQITARARTVLLVLLAASALVFVIACSNVANLILARSVRRESELAVRAALGASTATLRRTLLAESLLLCGSGAILGIAIAQPMVACSAKYAARFSVRALDLTLDASLLWVGVVLAMVAAVLLSFVPRLPSSDATHGFALTSGGLRITGATNRRLRLFAVTQIAASFVLLAGAGMLLRTLLTLAGEGPRLRNRARAGRQPAGRLVRPDARRGSRLLREVQRRVTAVPGVERVAFGSTVPVARRGRRRRLPVLRRRAHATGWPEDPRARFRSVSPGFFAALGIPIVAGRDFTEADRNGAERVVIVNQSVAQQLFPGQDPINRT
jgi:hypothetical protein